MDLLLHIGVISMAMTIKNINPKIKLERALAVADVTMHYSHVYNLDPNLLAAIIAVESRFKEHATGTAGEIGLMQLHPKFHIAGYDIRSNVAAGAEYLATIKTMFSDKLPGILWVEHYNRGMNCKPKTFPYAKRVMKFYAKFRGEDGRKKQTRLAKLHERRSKASRRSIGKATRLYARREREQKVHSQKRCRQRATI